MTLVLLVSIIVSVIRIPIADGLNNRLIDQNGKMLLLSSKINFPMDGSFEKRNKTIKNVDKTNDANSQMTLSILKQTSDRLKNSNLKRQDDESKKIYETKHTKQERKQKIISRDYPLIPDSHYYNDKKYQESNIFYIQLPPTPYTFVPGLGYISRPSAVYSSATLKPQLLPHHHLHQPPSRPQPVYQQTVNPFIELPIDFVSNGKPISVYQWQKKPGKKPADSPIMNLDNLSADFVNNGKPTSIYQWQTNSKPIERPNNSFKNLDKGPYIFNGKLTSLYLLGSDGSSSMHQSLRYPEYQNDYRNN